MEKPVQEYLSEMSGDLMLQVATLLKSVDDLTDMNRRLSLQLEAGVALVKRLEATIVELQPKTKKRKRE